MPRWLRLPLVLLLVGLAACADESQAIEQPPAADAGSDAEADAGPDAGPVFGRCAPGELALDDGGCQPAGIPAASCGEGFIATDAGGCEPVLPAEPCQPGEMAIPGESECRELAPCGTGTWGDIPVEPDMQHVDGAYVGNDSDGSAARPWTTIQAAVDAANAGAIVAVGAGSYAENVWIDDHSVRLWGKCPAEVEIVGTHASLPAIYVRNEDGVEVHDLAVTGNGVGISVWGGHDALADRVWLHDMPQGGFEALDLGQGCTAVLSRSLVESVGWVGAHAMWGAAITIAESAIRDSPPLGDDTLGWGVGATSGDTGPTSSLTLRRSLVERSQDSGVQGISADLTVEDSVVRDTLPSSVDETLGLGIMARPSEGDPLVHSLTIRRSVVASNRSCGVCTVNMDTTIESTVVRDTSPTLADDGQGYGIALVGELPLGSVRPVVSVRTSLIERNRLSGVALAGVEATVEGTIVRDIEADAAHGRSGRGLAVEVNPNDGARSRLLLRGSLVERSHEAGVAVLGSVATIESTVVRDTRPRPADGRAGRGVVAQLELETGDRAEVGLRESLISASTEVGFYAAGADAVLEDSIVQGTAARPDGGLFGDGVIASAVDGPSGPTASNVELHRCRVADNARVGLASFGSQLALGLTQISCNAIDLDGEPYLDLSFSLEDLGSNGCGCGPETIACQLASAGIAPPEPL